VYAGRVSYQYLRKRYDKKRMDLLVCDPASFPAS
jgi:hypothetical protein